MIYVVILTSIGILLRAWWRYNTPIRIVVTDMFTPEKVESYILNNVHACINRRSLILRWSALHSAASAGNYSAVKILLELGADPNAIDRFGNTPLHNACRFKDIAKTESRLVKALVGSGANPSIKNKEGVTPYDAALKIGNDHLVAIMDRHLASETKRRRTPD